MVVRRKAAAIPLSGTNPVLGYTFGATSEPGEPNHAFILGGHSVWWSWTAPSDGDFRVSVVATNLGTPLAAAVYTGAAVAALTPVSSGLGSAFTIGSDNVCVDSFFFTAQAGTPYSIAVDHGSTGDGFLSLAGAPSVRSVIGVSAVVSDRSFGFDFSAPPGAGYIIEASNILQT